MGKFLDKYSPIQTPLYVYYLTTLVPDKENKFIYCNLLYNLSSTAGINSAGIPSAPGDLCLFNFFLAIYISFRLDSGILVGNE